MFNDCKTELEKNAYKCSGRLKKEFMEKNKQENYLFYKKHRLAPYNEVLEDICQNMEIPEPGCQDGFIYFFDPQYQFDTTRGYRFENLTVDYEKVLSAGLETLKYHSSEITNQFCEDYNRTIDSLLGLARRIYEKHQGSRFGQYFLQMGSAPTKHLEEALQRILFVNQMLWQMGHRLMGLGHLDRILIPYYQKDIREGFLTREDALELLKDFLKTVHQFYWMKSNVLMGDTGQIIILGGLIEKGKYESNELTEIFIRAVLQLQLPDPKILLRVSSFMPRELMAEALTCMQTGIGSPLLSNDDVVIPKLLQYGVKEEDAYAYGTSACWEPLIAGKSASLNNLTYLSYPKVLQNTLEETPVQALDTAEGFWKNFDYQLELECKRIMAFLSDFRYQYNPLLSVFTTGCREKKKDVSNGGAMYSDYGFTTVGLSNTVNAILNIVEKVYRKHELTPGEMRVLLKSNFEGRADLVDELKHGEIYFGSDTEEAERLVNELLRKTSLYTEGFRNYMGGRVKFGLSAPSYIDAAKNAQASFDGRKENEPFGVHISSERSSSYTEIVNFASELDYEGNRFNGNVVDFMVSPHFIRQNFEKFVDFLLKSIEIGFFQLQMNVVSSTMLIDAKRHPEKYPGLVVRVWGFSAFFSELPESYQDVLIGRALENERRAS